MKFRGILKSWVDKEAKVIVSTGRCKLLEILFVATICYLACNCERNYATIYAVNIEILLRNGLWSWCYLSFPMA